MIRRYALYWLPAPGSGLEAFGRSVLGYDNVSGHPVPHPDTLQDLGAVTAGARVYGFHATLKAPLRLALLCRTRCLNRLDSASIVVLPCAAFHSSPTTATSLKPE